MNRKAWLLPSLVVTAVTLSSVYAATPLMVEKNLFSQDRKPSSGEAPAPAAQTGPPVPPKAIQLDGIMIQGSVKKALLRLKAGTGPKEKGKKDSPFTTVSEGEKVNDYTVTKIGTRSVSLEKGGQTFEVFLYAEGKVLPPLAPSPAPGPAAAPGQPGQPGQPQVPPRVQGGAIPQVPEGEPIPGSNPALQQDPNMALNPSALQGQRGSRRAPPQPAEPLDADDGGDDELEDAGQ